MIKIQKNDLNEIQSAKSEKITQISVQLDITIKRRL